MTNYPNTVLIFESIELASLFIALCILGTIKNLLEVDGYFYEPDNREHGGCRKFILRRLGP
jgi:elongation factor P hydroxylase